MAKKGTRNESAQADAKGSQRKRTALAAVLALLAAPVVWLVGPSSGLEWLKSLLIAVGLALVIRWVFAEPFRIPSGSMEPTLHGEPAIFRGDRVFVNKLVYGLRYPLNGVRVWFTTFRIEYASKRVWQRAGPQRWDIVVFKSAEPKAKNTTLVKRVVGLPGERIHIANGKVYANGEPLELPPGMPPVEYTRPRHVLESGMKYGVLEEDRYAVVPDECYLVLGDNSARSRDGRYFGWLHNERILGRVSCIWWPPARWRDFTGFSKTWWWRTVVAVVSVLLFVRVLCGRSWRVHRRGEKDTIKADHVYVNRWAFGVPIPFTLMRLFRWGDPRRGDLVLYRRPNANKDQPKLLVGRVAGLGGERVVLNAGKLEVNGAPLETPASLAGREFAAPEGVGPYARSKGKQYSRVPEDRFFILTESEIPEEHWDSRTVGWVAHEDLMGRASAVWWPPTRWRRIR